jgi:peroxiredoxin 2/4
MKKEFLIFTMLAVPLIQMIAQDTQKTRMPLIGDVAPSFNCESTEGKISFPRDYGTSWKIIFSHPRDFTPVCSSELLELARQQDEYAKLGVKIIVLSTDLLSMHESWKKSLEEISYKGNAPVSINFPIVADDKFLVSNKYGMIHPSTSTSASVRAVFIIDPNNKIRSILYYPMEVGRNMDEILRTVVALQTVGNHNKCVAPANWEPGDKLMLPNSTTSSDHQEEKPGSDKNQEAWFMKYAAE